jgi:ADP-heptose:LPS heptosyltransferase
MIWDIKKRKMLDELAEQRNRKNLDAECAAQLALQAVEQIIKSHRENREYLREAVTFLCELTSDPDQSIARCGVKTLFTSLIERLNDSFDPDACDLYNRIIAQVIEYYRCLPGGGNLDRALSSFGLRNEADLLNRKTRIDNLKNKVPNIKSGVALKKALFLSRVTIGADVALTSVMIAKLWEMQPGAEIVLLGSSKLRELFGGDPRVRVRDVKYERTGDLLSRLSSWIELVAAVEDERKSCNPDQFWLIDPDSRLTQLGMLPLLKDESNYFFFESRSFRRAGAKQLGHLASCWMNETFGMQGQGFPFVSLPREHREFGRTMAEKLRHPSSRSKIISISLGVGGNPGKRLADSFEEELIGKLLEDSQLILDKGASPEEHDQINRIIEKMRAHGKTVIEVNAHNSSEMMQQERIRADLLTWDGGIGAFAGLIAASDRYLGYDSAGQHIAAALGIPTLAIFVDSNSETFTERWRPYGRRAIAVFKC